MKTDLIDNIAGLQRGHEALRALRHQRDKVAAATQGSYDALFDEQLQGLSLEERLLVALQACLLTPAPELAAHYRARLAAIGAEADLVAAIEAQARPDSGGGADAMAAPHAARLEAMLTFTRLLIEDPAAADKTALLALPAAGLSTPAVVALAQLIAFLSYQVRLVAGLQAMKGVQPAGAASADLPTARGVEAVAGAGAGAAVAAGVEAGAAERAQAAAAAAATASGNASSSIIRSHGFTSEPLDWKAWLDVVDLADASAEQIAVLEESHPKAKVSDYYRLLVHQPAILRQRSAAFNAIMYAPRGMSRAERELGATVTSRINGCVYCASVHAQRFEQMARRNDVILQVFQAPASAGTTPRERAIVRFSNDLTRSPAEVQATSIQALHEAGLQDLEILDLVHSIAIFAWANRLMLNLGEPVPVEAA